MNTPSEDSAPPYEELFANPPNQQQHQPRSNPSTGVSCLSIILSFSPLVTSLTVTDSEKYATVPQFDEDVEHQHHHQHHHDGLASSSSPHPSIPIPLVTAGPHAHCEVCDRQFERREKHRGERYCCAMVAATFMVVSICILLLGVTIVRAHARG